MLLLWSGACTKNIYKINEGIYCLNETTKRSFDNLPGRHFDSSLNKDRIETSSRHIDFSTTDFTTTTRFSNQFEKVRVSACAENSLFGNKHRFKLGMEVSLLQEKVQEFVSQCQGMLEKSMVSVKELIH